MPLLLVAMLGATSSVLAPSCDALTVVVHAFNSSSLWFPLPDIALLRNAIWLHGTPHSPSQ